MSTWDPSASPSPVTRMTNICPIPGSLHGCWGFELESSRLQGMRFANCSILQPLMGCHYKSCACLSYKWQVLMTWSWQHGRAPHPWSWKRHDKQHNISSCPIYSAWLHVRARSSSYFCQWDRKLSLQIWVADVQKPSHWSVPTLIHMPPYSIWLPSSVWNVNNFISEKRNVSNSTYGITKNESKRRHRKK